jgi:hypothetical protein
VYPNTASSGRHLGRARRGARWISVLLVVGCSETPARSAAPASPSAGGVVALEANLGLCIPSECEIDITHIATIEDSTGLLNDFVFLVQDAAGRFVVAKRLMDGIVVFDRNGTFVAQFGRRGNGPGEFQGAVAPLIGPGDTILVPDARLGRLTVLTPELELVRDLRMMKTPDFVLSDGSLVLADQVGTRDAAGYPIHRLNADGSIARSFGTDTPQHRPDMRLLTTRVVGRATDGTVWAAAPGLYALERWDPFAGTRKQRVEVDAKWFRPSKSYPSSMERPMPVIQAVAEDSAGFVWVLIQVADPRWKAPPTDSERTWTPELYDSKHDWLLEVVDPRSQRVIASRRFDEPVYQAPGSSLIVTRSVRKEGQVIGWDIWIPRLKQEKQR